jgi:hypothetical protein
MLVTTGPTSCPIRAAVMKDEIKASPVIYDYIDCLRVPRIKLDFHKGLGVALGETTQRQQWPGPSYR